MTGGTGYIGQRVVPERIWRGLRVRARVRSGSEKKLARGAIAVVGNALDRSTFPQHVAPSDTFVQLVGVPHPSPAKAEQFLAIDLVSIQQSVAAAKQSGIEHFIYLSVAQPAPVMKDYVAVRAEGERLVRESGMRATFVRPWYVLWPGHRRPYLILPLYWIWSLSPKSSAIPARFRIERARQTLRGRVADSLEHAMNTRAVPIEPTSESETSFRVDLDHLSQECLG